jgi:Predicted solute binding protein
VTITVGSSVIVSTETVSTISQSTSSHSTTTTTTTSTSTSTSTTTSTKSSKTETETTDSLVPPARGTSVTTTTQSTTSRADVCPTGFYACSAVYHGGCCQTGRDCDTTSCPTTSSTTFVSNGVTIVEPVATGSSSRPTGKCAKGWFSCADTVGGGCCPSGYACGQSCTATAAHSTVAKEQATASRGSRIVNWMNWKSWVFGIILCMLWI